MKKVAQRIAGPFREFGAAAGLLYVIDRALGSLSPNLRLFVYEFMVQPIGTRPLLDGRLNKQLEIREIRAGDPEIGAMAVRPDVMRTRLSQNVTCLGAFSKGAMIGYMWFCRPTYDEDEVRCTYVLSDAERSVFDFDFYIFPEHRMGLAFVSLWNGANAFLCARGILYTFSRLTRFNVASRRAHKHLGWKVAGRALFLKAWRLEIMAATLAPFLHVSMTERQRVRVHLRPDVLKS